MTVYTVGFLYPARDSDQRFTEFYKYMYYVRIYLSIYLTVIVFFS